MIGESFQSNKFIIIVISIENKDQIPCGRPLRQISGTRFNLALLAHRLLEIAARSLRAACSQGSAGTA
jgi:hypothetical protein